MAANLVVEMEVEKLPGKVLRMGFVFELSRDPRMEGLSDRRRVPWMVQHCTDICSRCMYKRHMLVLLLVRKYHSLCRRSKFGISCWLAAG